MNLCIYLSVHAHNVKKNYTASLGHICMQGGICLDSLAKMSQISGSRTKLQILFPLHLIKHFILIAQIGDSAEDYIEKTRKVCSGVIKGKPTKRRVGGWGKSKDKMVVAVKAFF